MCNFFKIRKAIIIVLTILTSAVSGMEDVYFIRLNIDDERIELGTFSETISKEVETVVDINQPLENSISVFRNFFNGHIKNPDSSSILFFIHAMWGSNNMFVRSQVLDFHESYINDSDSVVDAVFYILWDTRPVTYGGNTKNAYASSEVLGKLFNILEILQTENHDTYNLMCHSMGNKVFFGLMENVKQENKLFDKIIFAAPDISENVLENDQVISNLNVISDSCFILFNKYDGLLMLSKARNFYSPLGFRPDTSISRKYPFIRFIDCSFLTDNNKFPSSVTGHLYYSTSVSTKRRIKEILKS